MTLRDRRTNWGWTWSTCSRSAVNRATRSLALYRRSGGSRKSPTNCWILGTGQLKKWTIRTEVRLIVKDFTWDGHLEQIKNRVDYTGNCASHEFYVENSMWHEYCTGGDNLAKQKKTKNHHMKSHLKGYSRNIDLLFSHVIHMRSCWVCNIWHK